MSRRLEPLVLLLLACTSPAREKIPVELLNHRTLVEPREGEAVEARFDGGSWPILRIPKGALAAPAAVFHLEAKSISAEIRKRVRGDFELLELHASETLTDPIRLQLLDGDSPVGEWTIRWAEGPDDFSSVRSAADLRKKRRFDDARKSVNALLPNAKGWERLWLERELGNIDYMAGEHRAAEAAWFSAAADAEALGAWTEVTQRLRGVAFLRLGRGDVFSISALLERAREIDGRFGDLCSIDQDEYYSGLLDMRLGFHERAHRNLRRAAELARSSCSDIFWVEVIQVLAADLVEVGRYREALAVIEKATLSEDAGPSPLARHLANVAWVRLSAIQAGVLADDYSLVRAQYERVVSLLDAAGTPQRKAIALSRLALIAQLEHNDPEAVRRLNELDRMPAEQTENVRAFVELVRARVAMERGRLDEAAQVLQALRGEAIARPGGDGLALRIMQGELAFRRGALGEAVDRFNLAREEVDILSDRLEGPRTRGPLLFKYREIEERRADALLRLGRADEAFASLDRVRAAAIGDLDAQLIPELVPAEWFAHLRLRAELEEREKKGCASEPPDLEPDCERSLEVLRADVQDALQTVYAAAGRSRARAEHREHVADELRRTLASDEIIVAIFRVRDDWITFRLDQKRLTHRRSSGPPAELVRELSPDHHHYLILGEGTGDFDPWLVDRAATELSWTRLPHASFLLEARREPLAGAFFAADADGTLPQARRQAEQLAAATPASTLLVGRAATAEAVLQRLRGRSLVHLAVHGTLRDRDPWNTRLLFAENHGLELHDFLAARAPVGLVVLAACWSGAENREGDLGLPEALLASGARSVLVASGELETSAAIRFIDRFYAAGGPTRPARAMRDAVRESIIAGDDAWKSFHLWGRAD